MKILAMTKYSSEGPSSRYRYYNYSDCFINHAISLYFKPLFSKNYLSAQSGTHKILLVFTAYFKRFIQVLRIIVFPNQYKGVIIEYELFPFFSSFFERILTYRNIPFIVDYDDAIFHKYDQHKSWIIRLLLKNKIPNVMKHAETVIVGNDYLEGFAKKFNKNTLQLPTVVLLDKYISARKNYTNSKNEALFTIGWIGSKTTSPYLLTLLPVIESFISKINVRCHFIGFDENLLTDEIKQKCKITIVPWSEATEIQEILKFDVGIMPLKDDAWSKGKCGFKLIQYMSCKKPVIASPVGINTTIVEEGVNGFLASTDDEWYSAFEQLYSNKSLRKVMAENNWQKILKDYNHQINCDKYVNLIKNIVGRV